jgi:hypothetical protein
MYRFPWEEAVKPRRLTNKEGAKIANGPEVIPRPCRLDMRLTKVEKKKLDRKAKTEKRTITSIISELIANMG